MQRGHLVIIFAIATPLRCLIAQGTTGSSAASPSSSFELKLATATPSSKPLLSPVPNVNDKVAEAQKEAELRKAPPESLEVRRQVFFAIYRAADYRAMMANGSGEEASKDRGADHKPIASGLCKLGSKVSFNTTDFRYNFHIVGSRSPADAHKVHLYYTFSISKVSPENPSALNDSSVLYVDGDGEIESAWQHTYVLFTKPGKPEYEYALTFRWWHSI